MPASIRPYRPDDRAAIRRICCETGYRGFPIDPYCRDREFFADLVTNIQLDVFPNWAWVAEVDNQLVGYVLGCPSSYAYHETLVAHIWHLLGQSFRHSWWFRPGTAGFFWRGVLDLVGQPRPPNPDFQQWPAFAHINLLPAARGRKLGQALMTTCIGQIHAHGLPGMYVSTVLEEHNGNNPLAFFTSLGFKPTLTYLKPGLRGVHGERLHTVIMCRTFNDLALG